MLSYYTNGMTGFDVFIAPHSGRGRTFANRKQNPNAPPTDCKTKNLNAQLRGGKPSSLRDKASLLRAISPLRGGVNA